MKIQEIHLQDLLQIKHLYWLQELILLYDYFEHNLQLITHHNMLILCIHIEQRYLQILPQDL